MDRLVLASQSPQRLALCRQLDLEPEVVDPAVDETPLEGESAAELVLRLAKAKAGAVIDSNPDAIVIAGDSVVAADSEILGKPSDVVEARQMLQLLSGRTHSVFTGLSLQAGSRSFDNVEETQVTFIELSSAIVEAYLSTGEWKGRAGACGIQGKGEAFISRIEGSYSNVVGLPVHKLLEGLVELGFSGGSFWGTYQDG